MRDHLAGKLGPGPALATEAPQGEAPAGEDSRAERLLETGRDLDAGSTGEKAVLVQQVLRSRAKIHQEDAAGNLRSERDRDQPSLGRASDHRFRSVDTHAV